MWMTGKLLLLTGKWLLSKTIGTAVSIDSLNLSLEIRCEALRELISASRHVL